MNDIYTDMYILRWEPSGAHYDHPEGIHHFSAGAEWRSGGAVDAMMP